MLVRVTLRHDYYSQYGANHDMLEQLAEVERERPRHSRHEERGEEQPAAPMRPRPTAARHRARQHASEVVAAGLERLVADEDVVVRVVLAAGLVLCVCCCTHEQCRVSRVPATHGNNPKGRGHNKSFVVVW